MEHFIFSVNPSAPNASKELVFNDPTYVEENVQFSNRYDKCWLKTIRKNNFH